MQASYWWCALLMLGSTQLAYADKAADDAPSMEVIEMLGGMDGDVADLEIAMSNVKIAAKPAEQETKVDEKATARKMNGDKEPASQEVENAK
jgi:hypothetical protein